MMIITFGLQPFSFSLDLLSSPVPGSFRDCPQTGLLQVPEPLIPDVIPDVIRALSPEEISVAQPPLLESLPKMQIDKAYAAPDDEFYCLLGGFSLS